MRKFVIALVLLAIALPAAAQQAPVAKGLRVHLKIPRLLFTTGPGSPNCVYCFPHTVDIETTESGALRVAGREDWESASFPTVKAFTISKIEQKDGFTIVHMKDSRTPVDDAYRTLRFKGGDLQKAFWQVALPLATTQAEIDAYSAAVMKQMAEKAFPAETSVKPEQALELMTRSRDTEKATSVSRREFKGKKYLAVHLGVSKYEYNDLKVSDAQRLAAVFKDRLLSSIRGYVPLLEGSTFDGLLLRIVVPHKEFGPGFAGAEADDVEFFVPLDLAKKFTEADISAQELVRGSIVLNNGNRFDVDLSKF